LASSTADFGRSTSVARSSIATGRLAVAGLTGACGRGGSVKSGSLSVACLGTTTAADCGRGNTESESGSGVGPQIFSFNSVSSRRSVSTSTTCWRKSCMSFLSEESVLASRSARAALSAFAALAAAMRWRDSW
jgi:hypothetical protein